MVYTVSITSQGQMSVPIAIRRSLGLDKTNKALVYVKDNRIIVEPVKDLLELGGSLKTHKKPLSNDELHEVIAMAIAEEVVKK